jgi:hypothetical protein
MHACPKTITSAVKLAHSLTCAVSIIVGFVCNLVTDALKAQYNISLAHFNLHDQLLGFYSSKMRAATDYYYIDCNADLRTRGAYY